MKYFTGWPAGPYAAKLSKRAVTTEDQNANEKRKEKVARNLCDCKSSFPFDHLISAWWPWRKYILSPLNNHQKGHE